ncbi:MAG: phosphoglucosamine mutase [Erysipelotrichaceae bacterium]|nr:phosphoglucosamine mutase [Erysipelotrichaceae bacterium]
MKYFGTDGIRGVPNQLLNVEFLIKLGKSLNCLDSKEVVIATDTRISKDMITSAISAGAMSMGLNVKLAGVISTPALIYYSMKKQITGVMITASHNPYIDNGIKILNKGIKLNKEEELKIEELIDKPLLEDSEIGKLEYDNNLKKDYIDFVLNNVVKTNKRICIDCANGSTTYTALPIFKNVTDDLVIVGASPDGYNINEGVGSTHINFLRDTVINNKCDIGFSFDGDGDRVICVDNNGNVIDGDMIIYLIARYLKKNNKLNDNTVVLSIMSNLGLIKKLVDNGISVYETPVGDKHIYEALEEFNFSIGGENSGHIIIPNILHTGDGVLIAIMLIKILEETDTNMSDWFNDLEMYADRMINVSVTNKNAIYDNEILYKRIDEIKKELKDDCKIIVRPSGTEEKIRISVMAKDIDLVDKYIEELALIVMEMA